MPIYYRDDIVLASSYKHDVKFAKDNGLKIMKLDKYYSQEENLCHEIISACECLLDDFNWGEHLNSDELEMLKLAHENVWEIFGQVNERSRPSNIKQFNSK